MSSKQTRTPHNNQSEPGSGPAERTAGADAARGGALTEATAAPGAEFELALSDLVGDDQGEVVFFNDSDLRRLAVTTEAAVVADGRASSHRTAAGEDVSGFRFLTFDNGLTLYFRPELDVVVRPESG